MTSRSFEDIHQYKELGCKETTEYFGLGAAQICEISASPCETVPRPGDGKVAALLHATQAMLIITSTWHWRLASIGARW